MVMFCRRIARVPIKVPQRLDTLADFGYYVGFLAPKDSYIIGFSNVLVLGVSDEGYSRNASSALNLISTLVLVYTCFLDNPLRGFGHCDRELTYSTWTIL